MHLRKPVIPQPFDIHCTHGPLLLDLISISEPCCPTMLLREVSKSSNSNCKLLLTFAWIIGGIRVERFGKGDKIGYANKVGECMGNFQLKPPLGSVSQKSRNFSGATVVFISSHRQGSKLCNPLGFSYIKIMFKRSAFQNKRIADWQLAFRTRKVLGTFEKQAPAGNITPKRFSSDCLTTIQSNYSDQSQQEQTAR